jgi:chromobox protein 1
VAEFWRKNPKKKPRKSVEPKASKRGRKSLGAEDESDVGSAAKKRGRKPMADVESEEEDELIPRNKRTRKGEKAGKQRKTDDDVVLGDMSKYMDKDNWEDIVDTVDTVEKGDDGLQVFFTLYVA